MTNEILQHFHCYAKLIGKEGSDNVYLDIDTHNKQRADIASASASGGAYHHLGDITIENNTLIIHLKTIKSIFQHKFDETEHRYELCNPNLLEEVEALIHKAAINSQKAHRLAHTRMWRRHNRKFNL